MNVELFKTSNHLRTTYTPYEKLADRPLVSIITTYRNPGKEIHNAIFSIAEQSYRHFELILVDDGSDESVSLNEYQNITIKHLITPKNGRSHALNAGLGAAKGTFIAYLDADNTWDKDFLSIMIHTAKETDCDICYCAQLRFSPCELKILFNAKFSYEKLLNGNYIDLNSILHKSSLINHYGGFDPALSRLVDWDALLRWCKEPSQTYAVPFIGSYYADSDGGNRISNKNVAKENYEYIQNKPHIVETKRKKNPLLVCDFCAYAGDDFLPDGTQSHALTVHNVIGGGYRNNNICPRCGSFDRERSLFRAINKHFRPEEKFTLLHMAPEHRLSSAIARTFLNATIICADISPKEAHIIKADLTNLQLPDQSIDLMICSHILEHIPDDQKALSEVRRVLKPDGVAILQTPYSLTIHASLEDARLNQSPAQKAHWFGQDDHVRLYSLGDILKRARSAGLKPAFMTQNEFGDTDQNNDFVMVFSPDPDFIPCVSTNPKIDAFCAQEGIPKAWIDELGGWSLDVELVFTIRDYLDTCSQPKVLEFGAGRATKTLSKLIQNRNGTLYSFEHTAEWSAKVQNELNTLGLGETTTVLTAELAPQEFLGIQTLFYRSDVLSRIDAPIDLVIADGPPGTSAKFARFNSLPATAHLLNKNGFLFILDDYDRFDEKMVVDMWKATAPELVYYPVSFDKQACLIASGNALNFINARQAPIRHD